MIGSTFLTGGAFISQAPFQALTFTSGLAKGAFYIGAALTLQGVSDMLFPLPETKRFFLMKKIQEYHLVFLVFKIHLGLVLLTQ